MFETILVPVDGSHYGDAAIETAAAVAKKFLSRMIVLHVMGEVPEEMLRAAEVEHIGPGARTPPPRLERLSEDIITRFPLTTPIHAPVEVLEFVAGAILEQARAQAAEAGVPAIETRVEQGDAAEAILATALHEKADLIVMGHRGLGSLERMLLGSVSSKVCQMANCSTLIAR